MKTEHILSRVNEIAAQDAAAPVRAQLDALAADLAAQIRAEYAAAKGVGSIARTIDRILKRTRKQEGRTSLHYAWIDAKGRQCICDGYQAYRLTEPLPLEDRPADAGDPIDLEKIVPAVNAADFVELPLPGLSEIKARIALERATHDKKHTPEWDFGEGRPVVNAAMLGELVQILPDAATIWCRRGSAGLVSPLYTRTPDGDAILLPIKSADYVARSRKADELAAQHNAAAVERRADEKRAKTMRDLLTAYADELDRDPRYALTPSDFEYFAAHAYQPA